MEPQLGQWKTWLDWIDSVIHRPIDWLIVDWLLIDWIDWTDSWRVNSGIGAIRIGNLLILNNLEKELCWKFHFNSAGSSWNQIQVKWTTCLLHRILCYQSLRWRGFNVLEFNFCFKIWSKSKKNFVEDVEIIRFVSNQIQLNRNEGNICSFEFCGIKVIDYPTWLRGGFLIWRRRKSFENSRNLKKELCWGYYHYSIPA